ncbi:keratin-associated protein 5-5-like isoform X2 [Apis laboriosa]|uniref:keratin-associated protein 5-5-like isoform X2 n=1 Tax=Apis laboriosa TaxID=183418 RepID=UPI001CC3CBDA|nr:keratin-associated protein 5-5-like isoform X2 [Apis laboriosa]
MRGNDQNCISKMQDDHHRPCCNNDNKKEYNNSFDIWQADESVGKNDGGYENINVNYTKDSGRMHFEKSASDCGEEDTLSKCNDIEKSRGQDHCIEGNSESRAYRIMNEKDDASSKEDAMTYGHQSGPNSSNELDDNERMRGGCGGPCGPRVRLPCGTVKVETACLCKREPEPCRVVTSCATCATTPCADRRSCCSSSSDRPVCKKSIIKCRPPCIGESPTCGGGGCCGGGCRGGCGKPGQTCLPNPSRLCTTPCRPCSPCSPPKPCAPQIICYCGQKCGNCCGSGNRACCCRTERAEPIVIESGCCRPKSGCECLGGGVDCQRCGRKVYQAEMQIVSGMPFHNTCFSCYCCRKPLEPLTYQENCGEIYCKQCYVRNFGPQGYGYGVGPGTLQTPM